MISEMNFAIRYLTRYEYDADVVDNLNALRVKPHGNGRQRCDEFSVRLSPEVRLHQHTDYFGTEVVEFEVSRPHRELTIDVRARVSTKAAADPPKATWEALSDPGYREAGGEFLIQTDDAPGHPALEELLATARSASSPLAMLLLISELIPDRFEYRRGRRTSTRACATCSSSALASARTSSTSACACSVTMGSPPDTCRGTCSRPPATAARSRSRSTPTHGWRLCFRSPGWRAGVGGR